MKKEEFLKELETELALTVPSAERTEILEEYAMHFEIGESKGRKEEDMVKSLGSAKEIAKQYKFEGLVNKAEQNFSLPHITRAVFATVGLGFFNVVFLVGPFISVIGFLISMFFVAMAIGLTGLTVVFSAILDPFTEYVTIDVNPVGAFFAGLALIFLSILLTAISWLLTKLFYKLTLSYLKLNIKIINNK